MLNLQDTKAVKVVKHTDNDQPYNKQYYNPAVSSSATTTTLDFNKIRNNSKSSQYDNDIAIENNIGSKIIFYSPFIVFAIVRI